MRGRSPADDLIDDAGKEGRPSVEGIKRVHKVWLDMV